MALSSKDRSSRSAPSHEGRPDISLATGSLDLSFLGPVGKAISEIFQPKDEHAFSFAFGDERSVREFHEDSFPSLESLRDELDTTAGPVRPDGVQDGIPGKILSKDAYDSWKIESLVMLTDYWRLTVSQQNQGIASRVHALHDARRVPVRTIPDPSGLGGFSGGSSNSSTKPAERKPGAYFGLGALAPGRQLGLTDWKASCQKRSVPQHIADKVRFVFGVYTDLGDRNLHWAGESGDSLSDASTRSRLFLHSMESYKDNLGPKISAFKRWAEWCQEQNPQIDHRFPSVEDLGAYLLHKGTHGRTAASSTRATLHWWREKVGVPLPTDHKALLSFKKTEPGHVVYEGKAPEPWMLLALIKLAFADRGMISTYAALFAFITGSCMRFRHVQRSYIHEIRKNAVVIRCLLGKAKRKGVRVPFFSPTPREWIIGFDLTEKLLPFWKRLSDEIGPEYWDNPFLVPNVSALRVDGITCHIEPDSDIICTDMKYDKATLIFRSLLVEAGVSEEEAGGITLKSLRKFQATAGATFELLPEQLNALGDWQDTPGNKDGKAGRSKTLMPQTYSDVKIDVAYRAKKWLVAGICRIADAKAPRNRYNLTDFMNHEEHPSEHQVDLKWCTWDFIMGLSFASYGRYEALVEAAGSGANLGRSTSDSLRTGDSPPGAKKPRTAPQALVPLMSTEPSHPFNFDEKPSDADSERSDPFFMVEGTLPPLEGGQVAGAPETPKEKPQGRVTSPRSARASSSGTGAGSPQLEEGILPPAEATEEDLPSSSSESSEEEVEDSVQAASEMKWFYQTNSKVVHFYREVNKEGLPIPLCHCRDTKEEAPPMETPEGEPPVRKRPKPYGFSQQPGGMWEGFLLVHAMGLRMHKPCLKKVPAKVAELFLNEPP